MYRINVNDKVLFVGGAHLLKPLRAELVQTQLLLEAMPMTRKAQAGRRRRG